MSFLLALMILLAWIIVVRRHGVASFASAGILGFTIYSIPAVLNLRLPFDEVRASERYLAPAHPDAQIVTAVAWLVVGVVLAFARPARLHAEGRRPAEELSDFILALTVLGVLGFIYMTAESGVLFFLKPREEQISDFVTVLWKWIGLFGLAAATLRRDLRNAAFFALLVAITFLRGDRTMVALSFVGIGILSFRGFRSVLNLLRPKYVVAALVLAVLILVGKPLYQAVKAGDMQIFATAFSDDALEIIWLNFEPFATYNHLDFVVATGFTLPLGEVVQSILGQALIVPSYFDIETNLYNVELTAALPAAPSYGVAGNFWAHAWSVGGYAGVVVFALLYAASLALCDRMFPKSSSFGKILITSLGTTVAVYAHRNGLDNLLSFVRQILVVLAVSYALAFLIKNFRRSLRKQDRGPKLRGGVTHSSRPASRSRQAIR